MLSISWLTAEWRVWRKKKRQPHAHHHHHHVQVLKWIVSTFANRCINCFCHFSSSLIRIISPLRLLHHRWLLINTTAFVSEFLIKMTCTNFNEKKKCFDDISRIFFSIKTEHTNKRYRNRDFYAVKMPFLFLPLLLLHEIIHENECISDDKIKPIHDSIS